MNFKKLLLLLSLTILFVACKSSSAITTSKKETPKEKSSRNINRKTEQLIEDIITTASDNIGVKYKYAGTTKAGYDCSGLIFSVFKQFDITLPRNSFEQSKVGEVIQLQKERAKKGDLIFFTTNNSKKINHVGLVTDVNADGITFIHSSTSKGVIFSSTKEPYYKRTLLQVNRIF